MTLVDLDRLVRRLLAAMQSPADAAEVRRLAEEYAGVRQQVNARLRQCEASMGGEGGAVAIQLAEAPPHLMDMIVRVEFREVDAWRSFCTARRLPVPEPLEERVVRRLNDLYAQGIRGDDPLYQAFRAAVLSRREEDALAAVRTIRRLNPQDANAASEATRLDARVLSLRLARLQEMLTEGRPAAEVAAEVERIEATGFESKLEGAAWREGQELRCLHLLDAAEAARRSGDWRVCLRQLELCEALVGENSLNLAGPAQVRKAGLRSWGDAQQREFATEAGFRQLLADLEQLLSRNEEKDTVARAVPSGEMKSDFEALHRIWRSIVDAARPVPPQLQARFEKRSGLLAAEIARRNQRRWMGLSAAAVVVVLVLGVAGWFTLRWMKAADFAQQLDAAVKARQVRTVERLVGQLRAAEAALLAGGRLSAAVARSESFLGQEKALAKAAEEAVGGLPAQPAAGRPHAELTATQQQFVEAARKMEAMAPDLQAELRPKLSALQSRWNLVLDEERPALESALQTELQALVPASATLVPALEVEEFRRRLAAAGPVLARATALGFLTIGSLEVGASLRGQVVEVSNRLQQASETLQQHDQALGALRAARSFEEQSAAVALLAKSDFKSAPLVQAAQSWRAESLGGEVLLQKLLAPGHPGLVAYLKASTDASFLPKAAMPAEVQLLERMKTDISDMLPLNRWRVEPKPDRGAVRDWIAIGAPPQEPEYRKVMAYEALPESKSFYLSEREVGYFNNLYYLSPTEILRSLTDLGPCEEHQFLANYDFRSLLPVNDAYPKPLLPQLTLMADTPSASPLLRASLFLRFSDVMALRPEEWGLAFSPSAQEHRALLAKAMKGVAWADWLVPSTQQRVGPEVRSILQQMRGTDYFAEAQALVGLGRTLAKAGPRHVGFVEAGGTLYWVGGAPPREAWSFSAAGEPLLVVADGKVVAGQTQPAPLSPLFAFDQTRQELSATQSLPSSVPPPPIFQGLQSSR